MKRFTSSSFFDVTLVPVVRFVLFLLRSLALFDSIPFGWLSVGAEPSLPTRTRSSQSSDFVHLHRRSGGHKHRRRTRATAAVRLELSSPPPPASFRPLRAAPSSSPQPPQVGACCRVGPLASRLMSARPPTSAAVPPSAVSLPPGGRCAASVTEAHHLLASPRPAIACHRRPLRPAGCRVRTPSSDSLLAPPAHPPWSTERRREPARSPIARRVPSPIAKLPKEARFGPVLTSPPQFRSPPLTRPNFAHPAHLPPTGAGLLHLALRERDVFSQWCQAGGPGVPFGEDQKERKLWRRRRPRALPSSWCSRRLHFAPGRASRRRPKRAKLWWRSRPRALPSSSSPSSRKTPLRGAETRLNFRPEKASPILLFTPSKRPTHPAPRTHATPHPNSPPPGPHSASPLGISAYPPPAGERKKSSGYVAPPKATSAQKFFRAFASHTLLSTPPRPHPLRARDHGPPRPRKSSPPPSPEIPLRPSAPKPFSRRPVADCRLESPIATSGAHASRAVQSPIEQVALTQVEPATGNQQSTSYSPPT